MHEIHWDWDSNYNEQILGSNQLNVYILVVGCINGESISRANKKFEKDCKDYSVAVMLEISNKMQWELNYPNMIPAGGVMDLVPVPVLPGIKEAAVMRKKGYWATGSYGTVSWDVKDKNLQVIVMWDAPLTSTLMIIFWLWGLLRRVQMMKPPLRKWGTAKPRILNVVVIGIKRARLFPSQVVA